MLRNVTLHSVLCCPKPQEHPPSHYRRKEVSVTIVTFGHNAIVLVESEQCQERRTSYSLE
jgi:hypothetical protein